ncbi:tRNA dimethylallyltransferase [Agrilus planipennis]|uniref:tRNA dimethylallyltransferase n=1 Tax=Agrilus planipennis TaxID=224129 RepID=A0A1W4XCH3_AGRPL|nr:tRNA dimethylallyltransferase [Agrilus planipennis]
MQHNLNYYKLIKNLNMKSKLPLVVILGATGTGKTKLSLQLAQHYKGEIISADSMQLYKGLDVITAKATKQERAHAPHHLIDVINPTQMFTVTDFKNQALKIIENLFSKNVLPVIVGGTNYYIEALLWNILIENSRESEVHYIPGEGLSDKLPKSSQELHKELEDIDPEMAKRVHPNNKRKIVRSLEIAKNMGVLHSEIIKQQQALTGGSSQGGPLRFFNSLILWLQCDQTTLDERLNNRVDSMVKEGLLNELLNFHKQYNDGRTSPDEKPDYTKGIFQSIGFKEFHEYLMLNETERQSELGQKLLQEGIVEMKMVTRRFSRKQSKWIKNRFLGREDREVPPVYGLDTTDPSLWDEKVYKPARNIIDSFMEGVSSTEKPLPRLQIASLPNSKDDTYKCDVCDRIFVGQFQWSIHLNSHKHKRVLAHKRKRNKTE